MRATSKFIIFFLLVGLNTFLSVAQRKIGYLSTGYIITNDLDTLTGDLDFDYDLEIIQLFYKNGKILAFSPNMINGFNILSEKKIVKQYKTYFYNPVEGLDYKKPSVFLVIHNSNIELIAKEKKVRMLNSFSDPMVPFYDPFYSEEFYSTERIEKNYFLYFNQNAIQLHNLKKDIISLFPNHESSIKEYIKSNNLNVLKEPDLIEVVKFLNTITN